MAGDGVILRTVRRLLGIRSPSLEITGVDIARGFADGLANPRPLTADEMTDMLDKARRLRDLHFPDD